MTTTKSTARPDVAPVPSTAPTARKRFRLRSPGSVVVSIVIAAYVLISVLPVLTIILGSLKTTQQIVGDPLGLPNPIQFDNYIRGWNGVAVGESMSTYFLNTTVFSAAAVLASIVAGTMAAYAIARKTGFFAALFERYFVILYALPFLAVIIPLFSVTGTLGLRSNPLGIGLVFAAGWLPLTVTLMYAFFASFPLDVIEAAKTDGASEFRIFWTIAVPMSKSAILSNLLLAFIYAWNNLSHTLPLLVDPKSTTVAPGLLLFSAQYSVDLGAQLAGMVISIVPLVLAYALLHKHIMESFKVGSFR
ncbi:carbohydrate ABC transporter permease [Arthrobacter sp. NPDC056727]|uniref:carbohydrate ABC transporter permease n=1 Tax=Arthrobacter sp. NPDC056727 TaxID=3345927 RepID=UPI00366F9C1B